MSESVSYPAGAVEAATARRFREVMAAIEERLHVMVPKGERSQTSGRLFPMPDGSYRFIWDSDEPAAAAKKPEATTEQKVLDAYTATLTDEASGFTCGGLTREKHLRLAWLHKSGMIDLWQKTNYG